MFSESSTTDMEFANSVPSSASGKSSFRRVSLFLVGSLLVVTVVGATAGTFFGVDPLDVVDDGENGELSENISGNASGLFAKNAIQKKKILT